jgi:Tol biopolymer transport system component
MLSVTKGIFSPVRFFAGLVLTVLLAGLLAACGDEPVSAPLTMIAVAATPTNAPAPATTSAPVATTAPSTALPTVTNLPPAQTTAIATTPARTTVAATTPAQTTVAATTAPVQTTSAPATTAPAGSPRRLAFVDNGNLKVIDANGQNVRTVLEGKGEYARMERPDWSPDNTQLVFPAGPASGNVSSLYLSNLSGSVKKLLANQPAGTSDREARFSPDGKLIAFTRVADTNGDKNFDLLDRSEVWIVEAGGQNPRKLTDGRQPAFAPDNGRIAFVTNGTITDGRVSKNAIGMINAQGQNRWEPFDTTKMPTTTWIDGSEFGSTADSLSSPVWLDNGRTLGFLALGHHSFIATINASTGRDVKLWDMAYDASFGSLDSSAKGAWLVGLGLLNSGVPTTHIIDTTGKPDIAKRSGVLVGGPRPGYAAIHPTVSADGSFVAFVKVAGNEEQLEQLYENLFNGKANGSLVIAQVKNGKTEEREVAKGTIWSLAWSK